MALEVAWSAKESYRDFAAKKATGNKASSVFFKMPGLLNYEELKSPKSNATQHIKL